jgi:hypothetical protein
MLKGKKKSKKIVFRALFLLYNLFITKYKEIKFTSIRRFDRKNADISTFLIKKFTADTTRG